MRGYLYEIVTEPDWSGTMDKTDFYDGCGYIANSFIDRYDTCAQNGGYSYSLSESESSGFIDLLNQVKLGNAVDERDALSNGAVSYFTLYYTDGETLTISPGQYFKIEDTYYEFKNYDELWDKFIVFNSLQ